MISVNYVFNALIERRGSQVFDLIQILEIEQLGNTGNCKLLKDKTWG